MIYIVAPKEIKDIRILAIKDVVLKINLKISLPNIKMKIIANT